MIITNKVKVLDKRIQAQFFKILGAISTILSFLLIFFEIPESYKKCGGIIFIIMIFLLYCVVWLSANNLAETNLNIGGTSVYIKKGNIFDEVGLKVIPFNEYFDTTVDDKIIAKNSLNGKYIINVFKNVSLLNNIIEEDSGLNTSENILQKKVSRDGRMTQYKLGSSIVIEDYVLTAFSKFNDKNEANLSMIEYINFLLQFWNEINRVYAQKSVTVPIFGSGITRFNGKFKDIDVDELLKIMIWTFRISETRFKYPAKLTIVIYEGQFDKINLFSLQEEID